MENLLSPIFYPLYFFHYYWINNGNRMIKISFIPPKQGVSPFWWKSSLWDFAFSNRLNEKGWRIG